VKPLLYKGSQPELNDLYPAVRHRSLILLRAGSGLGANGCQRRPNVDPAAARTLVVVAMGMEGVALARRGR
jgi:hypothetical protein